MQSDEETFTIGRLAKVAGVHVETIRYYQRRGLLPQPERPPGGIRRYGQGDLARLTFVKTAQRLGFTLDEVGDLLRLEDGAHCDAASALGENKLADVRAKIQALQRIEKVLADLIDQCHTQQSAATCPLIASLHDGLEDITSASTPAPGH